MKKTAILFGSIGSIVESSDIQRRAYNQALREAGLNWEWDRETYAELVTQSGGKERLAMLAAATATRLAPAQIDLIHQRKTEIACDEIGSGVIELRPGVGELIKLAKARGMKLAFVTTTYQPNIDAIFKGLAGRLLVSDFDHITSRDAVINGKPAPDAFLAALAALGIDAGRAVAIEDTAISVMSAKRAGLQVIATPGEIAVSQDFWQADLVVPQLADTYSDGHSALDPRVLALLG